MTGGPVAVLAGATLRTILRRRVALAILVALPLALYLARHDAVGGSIRALVFGLSWAASTMAFFAGISAAEVEPRLQLAGWRRRRLVGGRLLGLLALAGSLTLVFFVLVAVDRDVDSIGLVALDFAVTTLTAMAVGTAVGALLTRELEGTLALFFLAGLQAVVNPSDAWAKALPFWSSREIGTVAIDGPDAASLGSGIAHAAVVVAIATAVALLATERPRPRRPMAMAAP